MNVSHKLTYTFQVSARELKMIRRALELEGNAEFKELAETLTKQVQRSLDDLKTHFETLLKIQIQDK
jgi:hypothetical protein